MKKTMKNTMKKTLALLMSSMMLMSNVAFIHAESETEGSVPEITQTETSVTEEKETKVEAPEETKKETTAPEETKAEAPAPNEPEDLPQAPEKPVAESYVDNGRIEEYNSKVDAYNEAAQNYNNKVDSDYETAVQETKKQNEEIAAHNAAEEARVKEAEARNEQAVKDAELRNAEIDEENAAGQAQAEKENDEKYESDLAQYAADLEQYKKDQAQYEYDVKIENQILAKGYKSVEHYNETINKHYNEPAARSVQKNAEAKKLTAKDTYTIVEAEEKSGKMITVQVEHHFNEVGIDYVEEFQIDANDIITFKAMCAPAENTNPGYACFYYNTDDDHTMGYWMESSSYVATNARYNNYGWECGDTHEISLKDGTNHVNDDDGITVSYDYMWMPLRTYKTYNTPNAPVAPTAPVKGEAVYEKIPYVTPAIEEIAAADIREFMADPVKKAYLDMLTHMELFQMPEIQPEQEIPEDDAEIIKISEIENVEEPEVTEPETEENTQNDTPAAQEDKKADTEIILAVNNTNAGDNGIRLDSNDNAAETEPAAEKVETTQNDTQAIPENTDKIAENNTPAAEPAEAEKAEIRTADAAEHNTARQNAAGTVSGQTNGSQMNNIESSETPLAAAEENIDEQKVIADGKAPMAAPEGAWALLNLIAAILTALISLVMIVLGLKKKDEKDNEEDDENKKVDKKRRVRVMSFITAIVSAVAFILTEDMTLSMQLTDNWTLLMAVLLIVQTILLAVSGKKEKNDDTQNTEMAEA